jgi:chromosome segregation ATPase
MKIEIHVHHHQSDAASVDQLRRDISELRKLIMATQSEQAQVLRDVLEQQKKTAGEITTLQGSVDTLNTKIAELEAQIAAGGDASQELIDAVAAVRQQAQLVDDQIPDVVATPPADTTPASVG